jgi:hypothetical protein
MMVWIREDEGQAGSTSRKETIGELREMQIVLGKGGTATESICRYDLRLGLAWIGC